MQSSWKSYGTASLSGLVIGLALGFFPTHSSNTKSPGTGRFLEAAAE